MIRAEWLLEHAGPVRAATFFGALLLMGAVERIHPRREPTQRAWHRWPLNFGLLLASVVLTRLLVPAGVLGVSLWAESRGFGILPALDAPRPLAASISFAALDLGVYAQHIAMHRVRFLWWLHRLHHSDVDLDASSSARFHPGEILVSLGWKSLLVLALGAPPIAVLLFEALLGLFAVVTHANTGFGRRTEASLGAVLVTPDLHRIHHSIHFDESNSNFGTITILWDRLFGTLRAESREPQRTMPLGVEKERQFP